MLCTTPGLDEMLGCEGGCRPYHEKECGQIGLQELNMTLGRVQKPR